MLFDSHPRAIPALQASHIPACIRAGGTSLAGQTDSGRTMPSVKDVVRIAAIGDLHYSQTAPAGALQPLFAQITETADVLVICGDLTDYGLPDEARALAREINSAV